MSANDPRRTLACGYHLVGILTANTLKAAVWVRSSGEKTL